VQRLPGFRLVARAGLVAYYLWFDSRPTPGNVFADARVRRAAALAVNRRELIADVGGRSEPLFQLVPQGLFGFVDDPPFEGSDAEKARALLASAGYPRGADVRLVTGPGASTDPLLASLGRMLGRAGFRVTPEIRDWSQMIADWAVMKIPFFVAAWRHETGEASSFLRDCLATPDPAVGGAGCNPGYANPDLDRLLVQIDEAPADNLRRDGYRELATLAAREMPIVPLFRPEDLYAVKHGVAFSPRLDGRVLAADIRLGE
jgi:peptide/nickel transport system substrate-binding protein